MGNVTTIGLDIANSVFQVHGVDAAGEVVVRRKLTSRRVLAFFEKLPRCLGWCPSRTPAGKEKLGSISKAGNQYLRQMLVVGAMAVIRVAERNGTKRPWLVQLLARRTAKVAAVALANKTAGMV